MKITAQNANPIPTHTPETRKHVVNIGNWDCKRVDDCHSFRKFDTITEAVAYMWGMAKAREPQKCWYFGPNAMEWVTNGHMRLAGTPPRLKELADKYKAEDDEITAAENEPNEEADYYAELERGYAQDRI